MCLSVGRFVLAAVLVAVVVAVAGSVVLVVVAGLVIRIVCFDLEIRVWVFECSLDQLYSTHLLQLLLCVFMVFVHGVVVADGDVEQHSSSAVEFSCWSTIVVAHRLLPILAPYPL